MDTPSAESEARFGQQLIDQGLATPSAVGECLRLQAELAALGVRPIPRLGDLLTRKGYVTASLGNGASLARPGEEPAAQDDLPPEVVELSADPRNNFGKYVRVTQIGSGGMGAVWKVWDRALHRWTALKFLATDDPNDLARFKREAWAVAQLNHPNIIAVYDVGEWEDKNFIAMQYVEGQTLAEIPRGDTKRLVEIVRDAALAVHAAHARGIIHRDLKPENIMVGTDRRVYVMDFGLAKSVDRVSPASASGAAVGTPAFMSPEQAIGRSEFVTARSDVYSLGATLYLLLTGRPPLFDKNVFELLHKIVEETPTAVRAVNPRIDRPLEAIVMKCLEKHSERRYATARGLARDLTRYLEGTLPAQRPASARYRQIAVAGAALVAAAILVGTGWGLARAFRKAPAPPPPPDADLRRRAAEREQELASLYFVRGKERFSQGDFEGAERFFTRSIELDPHAVEPYLCRGITRVERNEFGKAMEDYSKALEIDPRDASAFSARAALYARRGEYDAALEDYAKALAINPRMASAYSNRGHVYLQKGQLDMALADYSHAIELAPDDPHYLHSRGRARIAGALRVSPTSRDLLEAAAADLGKAKALAPTGWPYLSQNETLLQQVTTLLARKSDP